MPEWIHKYPYVQALLQAEEDTLTYVPDGVRSPSNSVEAEEAYVVARDAAVEWAEWTAAAEADAAAQYAAARRVTEWAAVAEADVAARYAAVRRALEDVRAAIRDALATAEELSARVESTPRLLPLLQCTPTKRVHVWCRGSSVCMCGQKRRPPYALDDEQVSIVRV